MVTYEQLLRARIRAHFREWVNMVKEGYGFVHKIPDDLCDKAPPEWDTYIASELCNMGLVKDGSGWTAKR